MAVSTTIRPLRFLTLLFLLALGHVALQAQVDNVYIYGTVKDYASAKKLDGITVSVFKNGAKLAETVTNASGKYEFNLDYGSEYKVVYTKAGIVSKNISIDTRNIPEEERVGGHGMNIEMTLFPELPGMDFSILQQPIGKAKFDPGTNEVTWDLQYTQQIRSEVDRLMKEYEEKKKREAGAAADYAKLMTQGESAMSAADYKKAVDSFTAALNLKAGDPKATARLSDAKMKLDQLEGDKKKEEQYAALVKEADGLFGKKDYEGARSKYQAASGVKEEEAYPKQKIKECDTLIADAAKKAEEEKKAKELEAKYQAALAAGDAAFKGGKYEDAKAKYTEASGLKPAEQYPKDQLAAIAKKLDELAKKAEEEKKQKELDAKYQAAIVAADAAFKAANYDQARSGYTEASGLKPSEKYPKDQLAAIDKAVAEAAKKAEEERKAKELDEKYKAAIAAGDAAFQGQQWDAAKAKYTEALGLKPAEKYPKDQLAAITEAAKKAEEDKKARELDEKYKAAIAAGDAAFQGQQWDAAKAKYTEALGLKPAEKYPKDQLAAIDKAIADAAKKAEDEKKQRELDDKYNAAVAAGDAAFQGSKWDDAKARYTEASGLKPSEKYPKDQLAAIDKAIAAAAKKAEEDKKRAELDARYKGIVDEAEALFGQEKYAASKAKFQEALGVKPDENHPKERIVEIDAKLADLARKEKAEKERAEMEAKYTALIASADKAFDGNKLAQALNDYKDASTLKPAEQYPKDRIAAIQQRMDTDAQAKAEQERLERERQEKDKRYASLLAQADKAFQAKQYDAARSGYTDASGLKPSEQYPKDQLAAIQRLLDEQAAKNAADRLKSDQDAAEHARLEEERKRKEADAAELDTRYRNALAAADLAFKAAQYDEARTKYTEALGVKPGEKYPKDQLAAIERALAEHTKAQTDAARLAEEQRRADEERRRKEAAEAEAAASEQERIASAKALEERYRKAIAEADAAFGNKDYGGARDLYTQALDIRPAEVYPQSKIEQIDKLLADLERARKEAELAARRAPEPEPVKARPASTTIDIRKEQEAEQFMREAREREEAEKYERIKKLKNDVSAEEATNASKATVRRDGVVQQNKDHLSEGGSLYQGNDALRKRNEEELAAFRAGLDERNARVVVKAFEVRGQMHTEMKQTEASMAQRGEELQQKHAASVEASQQEQRDLAQRQSELTRSGADRAKRAQEEKASTQEGLAAMAQRGEALHQGLRDRSASDKEQQADRERQLVNRAQDSRLAAKEQLARTPLNQPRDFADYNRSKLAGEYPQGVTEESYTEGNKVIIRRVVVQGNKADDYSKVIAKWGTFYFKNGQSISEQIWDRDTEE
ncbi:MAG: hypothetical protein QM724_07615 [Flavobacteriales bacterium]